MFEPKFQITHKILTAIGQIEACREVILNAPLIPLYESRFKNEALVRTVHHGTRLEGNDLEYREVQDILQSAGSLTARSREIQEVVNYRKVIDFIDEISASAKKETKTPNQPPDVNSLNQTRQVPFGKYTSDLLVKIHSLVMDKILESEKIGVWRDKDVVVTLAGFVTFRPPLSSQVPGLIKDFLDWLNQEKDIHPILQAGLAHQELVRIHPFFEGNGRVARALTLLVLFNLGYDIRRFFSLEEYYDQDITRYYQALQTAAKDEVDLTPWLEYFVEGLAYELDRTKKRIQKLSTDLRLKNKLGGQQIFLNERQVKIIEFVESHGYVMNRNFKELFPNYAQDTVLRDIRDLWRKGLLKKVGQTKGAKYIMP